MISLFHHRRDVNTQQKYTYYSVVNLTETILGGSLVTTAWRVLRLRMEGSPPVTEGNYENIE
jgi:hypothetical protein